MAVPSCAAPMVGCAAPMGGGPMGGFDDLFGAFEAAQPNDPFAFSGAISAAEGSDDPFGVLTYAEPAACAASSGARGAKKKKCKGKANAARVSRGTEVDTWRGLSVKEPERNRGEHITVTVVIYNTVAGGVPSAEDVEAAVDDMEALYTACSAQGRLADASFDFMKAELTVTDAQQIETKIKTQPYEPPSVGVEGGDIFPAAAGA